MKRGWGGVGIGREVWDGKGKDASLKRQNKRDLIYAIVLGGLLVEVQTLQLRQGCLVLAEEVRLFL